MEKNDDVIKKEKLKGRETTLKEVQDEKNKVIINSTSTPRPFVSKTTADIYGHKSKNSVQDTRTPKKLSRAAQKSRNVSPMKSSLKSSSSSVSQDNRKDIKVRNEDAKATLHSARQTPRRTTVLPASSVTVNSPIIKKKLNHKQLENNKELEKPKTSSTKDVVKKVIKPKEVVGSKLNKGVLEAKQTSKINTDREESSKTRNLVEVFERQRTKTRTLMENEVKVLTEEMVDNNAEMLKLSRKLTAKPKAFYIDLQEQKSRIDSKGKVEKTSDDEEGSYEDDFESYESDFDSYHSDGDDETMGDGDVIIGDDDNNTTTVQSDEVIDEGAKEIRDEERMLDSGSYELRDRSAKAKPSKMEDILEDAEDSNDKKTSLTDEGFQEMSGSSAVSSMKTVNVDLLDRPLFLDFTKTKQNKRRKLIFERLKQRAKDLLSMISLHEMTYSLFELKPVSYDTYMATFGRNNYTQTSVQTNEDNVSEEAQTDEIFLSHKWTQHPVEFSKHSIYLHKDIHALKYSKLTVDYIIKTNYMTHKSDEVTKTDQILNQEYKRNPLRIYLEQKDGVGVTEMLPYEKYKKKLINKPYNSERLKRVLKKFESRISSILSFNSGNTVFTDQIKGTKVPFSKGFITIPRDTYTDDYKFLNPSKITQSFFSANTSNLLMTVHKLNVIENKYFVCLWDISVANREPLKVLVAIDDIIIGRFSGNSDGIFVAALEDGTIHLWDLSGEPTCRNSVAKKKDSTNLVEINTDNLTEFEKDREWNSKNSHVDEDSLNIQCALHACSYTSSANVMTDGDVVDRLVGLEFTSRDTITQEGGRKIIAQVISLQRTGILTTWNVVQDKCKNLSKDLGKAYWSKMLLEKTQSINLSCYIDLPLKDNEGVLDSFNLTAAKKRLGNRKLEKRELKRTLSRPKSAMSSEFEFDRPSSVASVRYEKITKVLQDRKNINTWEDYVICNNLKVLRVDDCESVLVGKDRGEVLCCRFILGVVKLHKFGVASDTTSVTSIEVSSQGLPYFLAATNTGTVHLCSLLENRVLLTLDCRNIPTSFEMTEKCMSDHKGRFIGSVSKRTLNINESDLLSVNISVKTVIWSPVNPCRMYAVLQDGTLLAWDLTSSDIYGECGGQSAAGLVVGESALGLLTPEGEVQIHRFDEEKRRTEENLDLFKKYVALL